MTHAWLGEDTIKQAECPKYCCTSVSPQQTQAIVLPSDLSADLFRRYFWRWEILDRLVAWETGQSAIPAVHTVKSTPSG